MVGVDKRLGSIARGKDADMILVDGDAARTSARCAASPPSSMDGYGMDGDALRKAAGYSGRPK